MIHADSKVLCFDSMTFSNSVQEDSDLKKYEGATCKVKTVTAPGFSPLGDQLATIWPFREDSQNIEQIGWCYDGLVIDPESVS